MYITETKNFKNFKYVFRKPADFKANEKHPVIIFLHGAGTRGTDIERLVNNPFFTETGKYENDAVVFAPQCFADTWFDVFEQLWEFIQYAVNHEFCDKKRIYMMGASMGGYAVWQMAMSHPEMFAAIVPICGGGMYPFAASLKNVPVWAFHGDCDTVVYCDESKKMVDAVNKNGGNARLTICQGVGHHSWTNAYNCTEMYDWLFSKRLISNNAEKDELDNSEQFG